MLRMAGLIVLASMLAAAPAVAAMSITSADIKPGAPIDARHVYPRCGGANLSPQLSWGGAPKAATSFVVTMIDLDAKPAQWSHWIVVDLPATTAALPRGVKVLPGHALAWKTDFGDAAYGGPCPPKGSGVHHYQITVWALPSATLPARANETAAGLAARLSKLALDHAALMGTVRG
jgi:Raf kinase inhibitor-like YbhB/YbcL family protein